MPVKHLSFNSHSGPQGRGAMRRWTHAAALTAALGGTVVSALPANASILGQLRSSIHNYRSQRQDHYQSAQQSRNQASTLKHRAMSVHERLEDTQRVLAVASQNYENYLRQTKETEARYIQTKHEVAIAERKYKKHLDLFQRRLASFQRSGRPDYLQVFLGSRTLSDLTRRTYLYNAITKQDSELYANLNESKQYLEKVRNMLQSQWHQRNRLKQAAYREQARVVQAHNRHRSLLAEINNSRSSALSYAAAQAEAAEEMEGTIRHLSAQRASIIEEYRRRAAAERAVRLAVARRENYSRRSVRRSGSSRTRYTRANYTRRSNRRSYRRTRSNRSSGYDTQLAPMSLNELPVTEVAFRDDMVPADEGRGGLSENFESHAGHQHDSNGWCTPVRGRLSSRYGMRRHPTLGRRKLHTGADLAAAKGTPIKAAKNGTVLYSGWKKGYGNTVIIDHGDGVTTLYGHASKTSAKAGQSVKGGDYIGNVGSTGNSTGPHLHFEVRKNGKPVNPAPYLKKSR